MKEILNQETIQKILGIEGVVYTNPEQMARSLTVTFFPSEGHKFGENVKSFSDKLRTTLIELGVKVIPYEESLDSLPFKKLLKLYFYTLSGRGRGIKKGKKIKPGIAIISLGEGKTGNLPMDNTMGFAKNSVITIIDMPSGIDDDTEFHHHFDTAMNLFAYHMTNIAIIVDDKKWIPYNFNASHPIYDFEHDFEKNILNGLIPKIAAPIKPPKLLEFIINKETFDPFDNEHRELVNDFIKSGSILEKTNLYPPGKSLDSLPFRNSFHKWIGKIHLDNRNGMSYGFLARQMPSPIPAVYSTKEAGDLFDIDLEKISYFKNNEKLYIVLDSPEGKFCLETPKVWVLTQKSGSDKMHLNPSKDLIKIGLDNGKMTMQVPKGLKITPDYKPSFDTKVILAHAVGNAIIAAILLKLKPESKFPKKFAESGVAIAHWHGYFKPSLIPKGWYVHGYNKLPVACSTPQSAIFALSGKINSFIEAISEKAEFVGDIHIEPHHGTNICFSSLSDLGNFLEKNPEASRLGNHYFNLYKETD